ncbi:MAG: hypothetical protein EP314_05525, partial [Bacteroidetes bacterium]
MKRLLSFLLFLSTWFVGVAQQPFSYQLQPDDIPSQEVYRVLQDEAGYIWLGCNAGLFRYDGDRFKQFLNSEMSGRALSNLEIGPNGNVWCGSFTGQVLYVENDSLRLFTDWSDKERQFPNFTTTDNGVWVTSDNGLYEVRWDGTEGKLSISGSSLGNTENVFVSRAGRVVGYSNINGFFALSSSANELELLGMPPDLHAFKEGRAFLFERNGKVLALWQRFSDSRYVWVEILEDRVELVESFIGLEIVSRVNRVTVLKPNDIWVCTNAGAVRIGTERQQTFFSDQRVSDVFLDREGNYWFTTLDNGIFIMPSLDIQHFGEGFFEEKHSNVVSLVKGEDGSVLLGHFDGTVSAFHLKNETSETVMAAKLGVHRSTEKVVSHGSKIFAGRGTMSIFENGRTVDVPEGGNTKDLLHWNGDTFLIATVTGLSKFYPTVNGKWERTLIREGFCRKVAIASDRTIWASFKDGVFFGDDRGLEPFLKNGKPV